MRCRLERRSCTRSCPPDRSCPSRNRSPRRRTACTCRRGKRSRCHKRFHSTGLAACPCRRPGRSRSRRSALRDRDCPVCRMFPRRKTWPPNPSGPYRCGFRPTSSPHRPGRQRLPRRRRECSATRRTRRRPTKRPAAPRSGTMGSSSSSWAAGRNAQYGKGNRFGSSGAPYKNIISVLPAPYLTPKELAHASTTRLTHS
jgi:hypothetical protein